MNCVEHHFTPWDSARLYCQACGAIVDTRASQPTATPARAARPRHPKAHANEPEQTSIPLAGHDLTPNEADRIMGVIDEIATNLANRNGAPVDAETLNPPPRKRVPVDADDFDELDGAVDPIGL